MLEIYNEQVRDLLTKENPKGGLPVRQTPDSAFFVQGLKHIPVGSYLEISKRMEQGPALTTFFVISSTLLARSNICTVSMSNSRQCLIYVWNVNIVDLLCILYIL